MSDQRNILTRYWMDHFDRNVDQYRDNHAMILDYKNEKIMEQIHESILEVINPVSNVRVLDAGCGLGDFSRKIYSHTEHRDIKIFHIELSEKVLQKARKYLAAQMGDLIDSCRFATMDLMDMGFGDDMFDITVSIESLQHTDMFKGISEFVRVTKEGGKIAISVPNKRHPIIKKAETRNKGHFQGADVDLLMEFLQDNRKVRNIYVKPLIFTEAQEQKLYYDMEYKTRLSTREAERANRFVFCICL